MRPLLILLALIFAANTNAKEFGDWVVKQGGGGAYRFAEQYAKTTDCKVQRVDFTYSLSKKWEFTITTRYIADSISVYVDGKEYVFDGAAVYHKMSWPASEEFVKAIWNTHRPVLIEERYESGERYHSVLSPKGAGAAFLWAQDIK